MWHRGGQCLSNSCTFLAEAFGAWIESWGAWPRMLICIWSSIWRQWTQRSPSSLALHWSTDHQTCCRIAKSDTFYGGWKSSKLLTGNQPLDRWSSNPSLLVSAGTPSTPDTCGRGRSDRISSRKSSSPRGITFDAPCPCALASSPLSHRCLRVMSKPPHRLIELFTW